MASTSEQEKVLNFGDLEFTLEKLKYLITIEVFGLPTPGHMNFVLPPQEKVTQLEQLLDVLGVDALLESSEGKGTYEGSTEQKIKDKHALYGTGNIVAVLHTNKLGKHVSLVVASKTYTEADNKYHLFAISDPVTTRDWKEYKTLRLLCEGAMFDLEAFDHEYDRERPEQRPFVSRRLRMHKELTAGALQSPQIQAEIIQDLKKVSPAYAWYIGLQRQTDNEISERVSDFLSKMYAHK